jgi:hypothetical protein
MNSKCWRALMLRLNSFCSIKYLGDFTARWFRHYEWRISWLLYFGFWPFSINSCWWSSSALASIFSERKWRACCTGDCQFSRQNDYSIDQKMYNFEMYISIFDVDEYHLHRMWRELYSSLFLAWMFIPFPINSWTIALKSGL